MKLPFKISELRQDHKILREHITVFAWGLGALSFVVLATAAIQMPGKFAPATQESQRFSANTITLPSPGPVTTTASVNREAFHNALQVYSKINAQSGNAPKTEDNHTLHSIREEIISLRRSMLRLTEQNRRLSSKLKELTVLQTTQNAEIKENVTAVFPNAKIQEPASNPSKNFTTSKITQKVKASEGPLPKMELSKSGLLKMVVLPSSVSPKNTGSVPISAKPFAMPAFHRTPAAGKLHQSGQRKISRNSFAVDLGKFENISDLKSTWRKLQDDNPLLLSKLKKRIAARQVNGDMLYQLTAGPFYNAADTAVVCARLAREKINCSPARFQ